MVDGFWDLFPKQVQITGQELHVHTVVAVDFAVGKFSWYLRMK